MIHVYVPEVVLDQPRIAPAVCEVVARTVSKHVRKIRSLASLTDQVVDRLASEWPSLTAVQSSLAYDFFRFLRGPLKDKVVDRLACERPRSQGGDTVSSSRPGVAAGHGSRDSHRRGARQS